MYKQKVITELKKVVGWRDHYDPTEVPALPSNLTASESGLHYQSFFPSLVRLDYISALLPSNRSIDEFLDTTETDSITTVLSKCQEMKQLGNNGKDIISTDVILKEKVRGNPIVNESRFVGIEINIKDHEGLELAINRIGLYLNGTDNNINIYLFNSLQNDAIDIFTIPTISSNSFTWLNIAKVLNNNTATGTDGGIWYIGYYQDDLAVQATELNTFNWRNGYCGGCDGESTANMYRKLTKYVEMTPFYIAAANVPGRGILFNQKDIIPTFNNNWGINLNLTLGCDLSQYWIDNRLKFKNAIGYMVTYNILQMLANSSQQSGVQQNVREQALDEIKGLRDYKDSTFMQKVDKQIKAINLDDGNQHDSPCLPCARDEVHHTVQ